MFISVFVSMKVSRSSFTFLLLNGGFSSVRDFTWFSGLQTIRPKYGVSFHEDGGNDSSLFLLDFCFTTENPDASCD